MNICLSNKIFISKNIKSREKLFKRKIKYNDNNRKKTFLLKKEKGLFAKNKVVKYEY